MHALPVGMELPRGLDDVDAGFMTALLRARGVIESSNEIVSMTESVDVQLCGGAPCGGKR